MKRSGWMLACLAASGLFTTQVSAQFTTDVTDFETVAGATDFVSKVVFGDASDSTTTRGLGTAIGDLTYLSEIGGAPSPFTEVSNGARSLAVTWAWETPGDHSDWIRLTTLGTEFLPTPALHLQGKVRMWMGANAWTDNTFGTTTSTGNVFVGLGVRETGLGTPLGDEGGNSGDVEWVGLSDKLLEIVAGTNGICDTMSSNGTDDVQVVGVGMAAPNNGACVDAGTDGVMQTAAAGDDVLLTTPVGKFSVPTDGVMRLYEFDFNALSSNGEVFGFTGDSVLSGSPNQRGVLEHLVITNDPANAGASANIIFMFVDQIQFEAPIPDPPTIPSTPPPAPLDESVTVEGIDPTATLVEVIQLPSTTLASFDPMGATTFIATTGPLPANVEIVANQTVSGVLSDNSTPVLVLSEGNAPLRLASAIRETDLFDHGLACGADGTGFDPDQPSTLEFIGVTSVSAFGVPDGPTFSPSPDWQEVTFNPCSNGITIFSGNGEVDLNSTGSTVGVFEGLYFRIDDTSPSRGPFTIYLDDLVVKNADGPGSDCMLDDFESYTPGEFIVDGGNLVADTIASNGTDDVQVIAQGSPTFLGQIIIGPGTNGVIDTTVDGDDFFSVLHARFNNPGVAGTNIGVAPSPALTAVTADQSFSGSQSLLINFGFVDTVNLNNTLRLTSNGSLATNPPETFLNPDSVIPVEFLPCGDGVDAFFSVQMLILPPPIPGDCDNDGDVDLEDAGCFQICMGQSPVQPECAKVSLAPNGAPDNTIDLDDYVLFNVLFNGPK